MIRTISSASGFIHTATTRNSQAVFTLHSAFVRHSVLCAAARSGVMTQSRTDDDSPPTLRQLRIPPPLARTQQKKIVKLPVFPIFKPVFLLYRSCCGCKRLVLKELSDHFAVTPQRVCEQNSRGPVPKVLQYGAQGWVPKRTGKEAFTSRPVETSVTKNMVG